jgi:hypothetical protein
MQSICMLIGYNVSMHERKLPNNKQHTDIFCELTHEHFTIKHLYIMQFKVGPVNFKPNSRLRQSVATDFQDTRTGICSVDGIQCSLH